MTYLYCRLSQEDSQEGDSNSVVNQKNILFNYAKQNRFLNPTFFIDDGYSGTSFERPGFQKMLDEVEAGNVSCVIVKDLSRFGRNFAMTGMYTNITFAKHNVRFIAINDNYDTINPNSTDSDFGQLKRLSELNRLFIKVYEDNANAKISDERFAMMSKNYEDEQNLLRVEVQALQQEIEAQEKQIEGLNQFILSANKYVELDELSPYALRELVKAVYVEAPDKSDGKRRQGIHISYDFVGIIPLEKLRQ